MRFTHADHARRVVRLGYCQNLWPGETLEQVLAGLAALALPLRARLARPDEPFGVGLYVGAALARELARDAPSRARWIAFLVDEGLDPFTFNAFPYGGFHAERVKEAVFRPSWAEPARAQYTLDVASIGLAAWRAVRARDGERASAHLSISTHSGAHGPPTGGERDAFARALAATCGALAALEGQDGPRVVLGLEPEPRSSANDLGELALFRERALDAARAQRAALEPRLGVCLDLCHAAVEFEPAPARFGSQTPHGPLAKVQFSSALALRAPGADAAGRAALLALDEPRYLHQVTGRRGGTRMRAGDLPELARALADERTAGDWLACDEWRCHFHVPVDRASFAGGLGTTRDDADRALARLLADPTSWGASELQVEIETYTWDVLAAPLRGPGALVDGLEREYRHVLGLLEHAGWSRTGG